MQDVHRRRKPDMQRQHSARRRLFSPANWLKFKEGTCKLLRLEHSFAWCWNLDNSYSRSETPGSFEMWRLRRIEKISWTDRVRNEEVLVLQRVEDRDVLHTINRMKGNYIGHILRRNCFIRHTAPGKIKERSEATGWKERRRKQLLDDFKRQDTGNWEVALDRTLWRTCFGRGCGPVVSLRKYLCNKNQENGRLCLISNILPATRLLIRMHKRNTIKLHVQVFLRMNIWIFETCRRHYN